MSTSPTYQSRSHLLQLRKLISRVHKYHQSKYRGGRGLDRRSAAQESPDANKLPRYRSDIYRNLIMRRRSAAVHDADLPAPLFCNVVFIYVAVYLIF